MPRHTHTHANKCYQQLPCSAKTMSSSRSNNGELYGAAGWLTAATNGQNDGERRELLGSAIERSS